MKQVWPSLAVSEPNKKMHNNALKLGMITESTLLFLGIDRKDISRFNTPPVEYGR